MGKFHVKQRRAQIAERKRAAHGDPFTGKLKTKSQPLSVSGKRQRKLMKKQRREQKEAMKMGLVSMEDVEMAVAEGSSKDVNKTERKFHLKKSVKLKQLKQKGKKNKNKSSNPSTEVSVDAMVE